ncbi:UNVERIFIED_CONTAM: hypothetical protein K2H54_040110 [Gekko kuhli]
MCHSHNLCRRGGLTRSLLNMGHHPRRDGIQVWKGPKCGELNLEKNRREDLKEQNWNNKMYELVITHWFKSVPVPTIE